MPGATQRGFVMSSLAPPIGYAVTAGAENWVAGVRFANRLLRQGVRLLVVRESGSLERGSFVVPRSPALDPWCPPDLDPKPILEIAADCGLPLRGLGADAELVARPLSLVRVGLYGGGGAPFNHAGILAACGFPAVFLSDADVRAGGLADVDVFVMPGGGERAMFGQLEPLGEAGCRAIAEWVRAGGMYVGCCAGSYDCI